MILTLIPKKYYKILFYITVVVVLILALIPHGKDVMPNDKLLHIFAFFVLSLELNRASSTIRHRLRNIGALLAFGIFIELVQSLTPAREASLNDVIADLVGILLFHILYSIYRFYKSKKMS